MFKSNSGSLRAKLLRCSMALALLAAGIFTSGCGPSLGTAYKVSDKETVRYSGKATEDEAKRVADVLREVGYFDSTTTKDVLLKKEEGKMPVVTFVVNDAFISSGGPDKPETVQAFKVIGGELASKLGTKPITVQLVDSKLKVLKEIPIT